MPSGADPGAAEDTGGDRDQGAGIGTVGWILLVVTAWLVVATVVGVLVGRMVRARDRQVPPAPEAPAGAEDASSGRLRNRRP